MSEKINMELLEASEQVISGWDHFCSCIDFGSSALDAEAVRWMNEAPSNLGLAAGRARGTVLTSHAKRTKSRKKGR